MSKINFSFNDKDYSIEENALSTATAGLKTHLSTVMNGSGATIKFGGTSYDVDSAKLSTATSGFVSHLGTVAGEGSKVVVGGVEYSVDSTKVAGAVSNLHTAFSRLSGETPAEERLEGDGAEYYTLAPAALSFRSDAPLSELQDVQINGVTVDPANYTLEEGSTIVTFPVDYLKTLDVGNYEVTVASESKAVKGEFTVKAPELNEYGFYYNQPYTAYVEYFGGTTVFFLRENGQMDVIFIDNGYVEVCSYEANGNSLIINGAGGTFTGTAGEAGIYCNELYTNFVLGGTSVVADEDYLYIYKEDLGGYEVTAIDKRKSEYGAIKTGINGINTVALSEYMFNNHNNMIIAPKIPDSVTSIGYSAFYSCTSLTSITIPASVTSIGDYAFYNCVNLSTVTFAEGSQLTSIGERVFSDCTSITSIMIPASATSIGGAAFQNCSALTSIIFDGTVAQWNSISKGADWNRNTPATHVTCSDGQVTL